MVVIRAGRCVWQLLMPYVRYTPKSAHETWKAARTALYPQFIGSRLALLIFRRNR